MIEVIEKIFKIERLYSRTPMGKMDQLDGYENNYKLRVRKMKGALSAIFRG
jgi:hypothetical protein